ncbi:MAG: hydrogenase, partial [Fibrobacter sp.]|nr:hydrogenase [Fibrobacter sp.]
MITSIVTFAAALLFVGTVSTGFRKGDSTFKEIVPTAIAAGSLVILGYIVLSFRSLGEIPDKIIMNWQLPSAKFIAGIDPLTGFFMIPLMILSATCALYGKKYFVGYPAGRMHWFNYSLLVAGMVMVLVSRNAIMFILSWEIMAVSSFFLVITDTANPVTLRSGWIYFITAHIGTAFLFALFFLFSSTTGSTDFSVWKDAGIVGMRADFIFIFALIAFGLKAGFIPFHVWLPLAHPAAPSHVSALMSGIMIKMGIYGILRILSFITPYHAWWGILLIGIGAVSGLLGVLFAIGQHDIKRLLAYCSVENIGIILLGIGVGVIGVVYDSPMVALFGFAGGLLHIVNHSLFKALLFLGAGAVIRQTGTGRIDCLGGLVKTMPRTASLFLIGATAICGLPFFNG